MKPGISLEGIPTILTSCFEPNRVGESARDELFSPVVHDEAVGFAENRRPSGCARGDCDYSLVRLSAHCLMPGRMIPYDGTAACHRAQLCVTQLRIERLLVATHLSARYLGSDLLSAIISQIKIHPKIYKKEENK